MGARWQEAEVELISPQVSLSEPLALPVQDLDRKTFELLPRRGLDLHLQPGPVTQAGFAT